MTEREKILARLRKLRALSRSTNPHEAQQATAMAADLVAKHKVSDDELGDTVATKVGEWPVEGVDFRPDWRLSLLTTIASRYGCKTLRVMEGSSRAGGVVVGTKELFDVVAMIFRYFDGEIVPLAKDAWKGEVETVRKMNGLSDAAYTAEGKADFDEWMITWQARKERGFIEGFCLGATYVVQDRILCGDLDLWKIWKDDADEERRKDRAAEDEVRKRGAISRVDPKAVSRRLVDEHLKGKPIERFSHFGQASDRQAILLGKVAGAKIGMPGDKVGKLPAPKD